MTKRFDYLQRDQSPAKASGRNLGLREALEAAETGPAGTRLAETVPISLTGEGWNAVAVGCGKSPEEIGQILLRRRNLIDGFSGGAGSHLTGSWHKLRDLEKAGAYVPTSWRPL